MNPLAVAAVFGLALVFNTVVAFLVIATYNDVVALEGGSRQAWASIDCRPPAALGRAPDLVEALPFPS